MLFVTLLSAACTGAPHDSAEPVDTEDPPEDNPCEVAEIRVTGDDPPSVGDTWTVWLWCDDALTTGATRLTFDPPEIASVSENNAEFLEAGTATMRLQVGAFRAEREVEVSE